METQPLNLFERFNQWITESIMVKLVSIGFLILILLIPSSWVESLISERQGRADEVMREVSDKWSGNQTLSGPILVIPFTHVERIKRWDNGKQIEEVFETVKTAYFVPETMQVKGVVKPEIRHRGIFEVAVYTSEVTMDAQFATPDFSSWSIPDERVHWKEAKLVTGITDMRGISENPQIKKGEESLLSEPSSDIGVLVNQPGYQTQYVTADNGTPKTSSGIVIPLKATGREDLGKQFSFKFSLKGSEGLYIVPVGKTTAVNISGSWPSPSFDGKFLPDNPSIDEKGFSADWKILSFNRPFAHAWLAGEQSLSGSEFGVRLLIPADQYQKSMRTAKYGELIILLAFTALFLVEITSKLRIHPFQYILIGAALIIYYTLLLSISEKTGYNVAYIISSVATISLITLYASSFLKKRSLLFLFSTLMTGFYIFIFVIIQAQDFSLLIGSIGLFIIIGLLMYFSRNISWYRDKKQVDA